MPVRTYNSKAVHFGLPHDLQYNGCDMENDMEVEKLSKSLPFVDLQNALHHRNLNRDPICGVGDLPDEINPLQGHRLRSKPGTNSECTSPVRDPILLIGDLGVEYNCLYTTRDLKCKSKDDRNIITLEGQLGEELDPIRPHGGRPRNSIQQEEKRNPITGQGEYRKEWDPIWKYEGQRKFNRPEQKKRDPITHAVPEANMGEPHTRTIVRHFSNNRDTDIITHHYDAPDGTKNQSVTGCGTRHYGFKEYRDPITHENKYGEVEEKHWKPGTKHFPERRNVDDPITHHGLSDNITERMEKQQQARVKSLERVPRDPINGTGIVQHDCKTIWNCPNEYAFRSYLNPKKVKTPESKPTEKNAVKSVKKK